MLLSFSRRTMMARRMGSHRAARPGSDVDVGCILKLSHMNDYRLETRMTKHLVNLGVIELLALPGGENHV